MRKTLIKMAAGIFLATASCMHVSAQCALPIITSPNVTVCSGVTITISGTYSDPTPYSISLYAYGTDTPITTISNITTTSFSIPYTVPQGGPADFVVEAINGSGCDVYNNQTNDFLRFNIKANSTPGALVVIGAGSFCYNPSGYQVGLINTRGGIAYSLFYNGGFVSSLAGQNGVNKTFSGANISPGAYTISGIATASGCSNGMNGSLTIVPIPATPTINYTWCGAGTSLYLSGATTTTGTPLSYRWSNTAVTTQLQTISPPISTGVGYSLTIVANNLCTSAGVSITPSQHPNPVAHLAVLGSASSASVCLPDFSSVPYNITLSGGTGTLTANITRNGIANTSYSNTPGSYLVNYLVNTMAGIQIYSGTVSDAYCTTNITAPLLTVTAVQGANITITQTADCPSCSPQTRSFTATTDVTALIQWRYPQYDPHWGSLRFQPITTTNGWTNAFVTGTTLGITINYYIGSSETWPVTAIYNGCTTTGNGAVVPCATGCTGRKGLDEESTGPAEILYPNPASGELNIVAPYDNYSLSIYNLLGSEVLFKQVSASATKVDLAAVPAGTYVVKIVGQAGQLNKKLEVIK